MEGEGGGRRIQLFVERSRSCALLQSHDCGFEFGAPFLLDGRESQRDLARVQSEAAPDHARELHLIADLLGLS